MVKWAGFILWALSLTPVVYRYVMGVKGMVIVDVKAFKYLDPKAFRI